MQMCGVREGARDWAFGLRLNVLAARYVPLTHTEASGSERRVELTGTSMGGSRRGRASRGVLEKKEKRPFGAEGAGRFLSGLYSNSMRRDVVAINTCPILPSADACENSSFGCNWNSSFLCNQRRDNNECNRKQYEMSKQE